MAFDPNVSLGNIITITTTVGGLLIYFVKSRAKIDEIEKRIVDVDETLKTFRETDKQLALLQQETKSLKEDMKTNLLAVHNQRITALEAEMQRTRDNIHLIANQVQVELFTRKQYAK